MGGAAPASYRMPNHAHARPLSRTRVPATSSAQNEALCGWHRGAPGGAARGVDGTQHASGKQRCGFGSKAPKSSVRVDVTHYGIAQPRAHVCSKPTFTFAHAPAAGPRTRNRSRSWTKRCTGACVAGSTCGVQVHES